ncbi:MAG: SPASM domain-containing protein [candidate division WOR-3 bacterium]
MSNLRYLAKIAPEYYKRNVSFAVTLSPDIDLEVLNEFFESNELVKGHTILVNFVKPFDTTFFEQFDDKVYTRRRKQYEKLEKNYIRCRVDGKEPTAFEKALFEKSLIKLHIRQLDDLCDLIGLNGCCIPGLRKIFVDTDGRFYPCERVMRAYNIGDVDRGIEIDKIMNIARGYVMESGGDCINCWAAKICEICFAAAVKNSVFDNERKKLNCARMLNAKHHELSIYATIMEENPKAFDFTKDMVFI